MDVYTDFNLPLHLTVRPSRGLGRAVLLLHCLSPLPVLYTSLPPWIFIVACLLVSLHYRYLAHPVLSQDCKLILRASGDWLIATSADKYMPAHLQPGSLVHRKLTILSFNTAGGRKHVIITDDSTDPELFRKLRVFLRFPPVTGTGT